MSQEQQPQTLIKVNASLLAALSKGMGLTQVMQRDILVLECQVAGTSYRHLEEVEPSLSQEVKLELKREAANAYDNWAVALHFGKHKIGYIPRDKNEVIARLMDAGKAFFATIQAREWKGRWLCIDIKVYLRD
ncbi:MAG: HIRAN domain-containing protein [Chitinophagaceae bacterium]|nr:HIRAN domain-containing protein [Chitinophagaceae bacterium]